MKTKYISNKTIKLFIILFLFLILASSLVYINIKNKYISKEVFIDGIEEVDELYTDLLAEYETNFSEYHLNRSQNIKIATTKINGTVVLPGEVFSYNDTVGYRTELEGFKYAPMYIGGKLVDGIGGGVCQVSSTLYNAVLCANLEVVERKNHQFLPTYVEAGKDATVADGYIDFKFKNTRKYPIKIIATAKNGVLTVKIYGKKQEIEYDIKIQSQVKEFIPYETIYEYDDTKKTGEYIIVQNGKNGCECKTYKTVSLNGDVISKVIISTDKYSAMNQIIKVGTKL